MHQRNPSPLLDATLARLAACLGGEQHGRRLPSVVAGLTRGGALAWSAGRGDVPGHALDTQYRIGSITKTLVAVCVLRLRDEGQLRLSDDVRRHVPDAPVGAASVAQLLSHASGLRAETPPPWWERAPGVDWGTFARAMRGDPTAAEPGRVFHYSNVGYAVLGELVARARGRPWDAVVADEILAPLEMTRTTTRPVPPAARGFAVHPEADVLLAEPEHDAGAMAPAGQLWSTLADLSRWAVFLGGDTGDVLDADTLEEMRQPLVLDDRPGVAWTAAYGLGLQVWNRDGRRFVGHGGSMPGFVAAVRVDVASRDGAVAMTNSTAGFSPDLAPQLLAIAAEDAPAPPPWAPAPVPPDVLELCGSWYWGPAPFVLRATGDGLLDLRAVGEGRGARFRPDGDATWIGLDGYYAGERLRVVRGRDGDVVALDVASFVFTRRPYDAAAPIPGGVDADGWR